MKDKSLIFKISGIIIVVYGLIVTGFTFAEIGNRVKQLKTAGQVPASKEVLMAYLKESTNFVTNSVVPALLIIGIGCIIHQLMIINNRKAETEIVNTAVRSNVVGETKKTKEETKETVEIKETKEENEKEEENDKKEEV